MQNTAVVRLLNDRLAWYSPGASREPQWLDDELHAERLRAAVSRRRVQVCFAVPGADARLLTLPVTAAQKKHIGKSLPFTLEEQVAADIDHLHFASSTLDKDTLAVAVCARDRMDSWRELLAPFPGINQWLPEPLLLPWQAGEWCLVVEDDKAIVRLGECAGFSVEHDLLDSLLDGALREGNEPSAIVVYGANQDADTALLPESLRQRVQWRNGNLYAALMLGDKSELNLNLLQGSYAPRLPLERWWRQWRAVAAVFLGAFALQLLAMYADYRNLSAQNLALRAAVEASYRQAFPQGAVVDAEKQLRRQLDALGGSGGSSGFISLIDRVGGVVASLPGTAIDSINYNEKGDEMRMNVVAADFEGVEQLRSRIHEAGLEAIMESSNAQGNQVRARLRVGVRS